jgi:hypothetical protein
MTDAGSDTMMGEAVTLTRRESALVVAGDRGKEVVRYEPIVRNDIPDWVVSLINSIEAELNRMDALITQTQGSNIKIREALPELVRAYEALVSRQNEIYDAVALGVDNLQRAQLEHYSDIVAQSQVFAANVSAAIAIAKAQSSEAYEELRLALGMQIQSSSAAWTSLSGILEKRERAQERLALQVHTQSEELTSVKRKANEEAKRVTELKKKADAEKKQRESDIRKTRRDMEKKFREFTRTLMTKLSDESTKKSIKSLARSVLGHQEGDIKPSDEGFRLRYCVGTKGEGYWVKEAITPDSEGAPPPQGGSGSESGLSGSEDEEGGGDGDGGGGGG